MDTGDQSSQAQEVLLALLRELRIDAGLRQSDVARRLNSPQSMVSKYEAGERRLDILEIRVICGFFDLSLCEFVALLEKRLAEVDP